MPQLERVVRGACCVCKGTAVGAVALITQTDNDKLMRQCYITGREMEVEYIEKVPKLGKEMKRKKSVQGETLLGLK